MDKFFLGDGVFTNRQMWHQEPFRGAALTKWGSYQLPAPNASADVIYRFLSAMLRETKRHSRPLTSPRAAFISSPPLPAAHLSPRLKSPYKCHFFQPWQTTTVVNLSCAAFISCVEFGKQIQHNPKQHYFSEERGKVEELSGSICLEKSSSCNFVNNFKESIIRGILLVTSMM